MRCLYLYTIHRYIFSVHPTPAMICSAKASTPQGTWVQNLWWRSRMAEMQPWFRVPSVFWGGCMESLKSVNKHSWSLSTYMMLSIGSRVYAMSTENLDMASPVWVVNDIAKSAKLKMNLQSERYLYCLLQVYTVFHLRMRSTQDSTWYIYSVS